MYVKAAKFVVGEDNESRLKNGISYTYDELGRVVEVLPASYSQALNDYTEITNAENVSYTYDAEGYLSSIVTDSTTYTLTYDAFGNSSGVAAGDNTLAQYEYNANNGKLKKITYGNGYAERYVYDELERLGEVWYTVDGVETIALEYKYTVEGRLFSITDHSAESVTVYEYDRAGRVVGSSVYSTATSKYYELITEVLYDADSRITAESIDIAYFIGTNQSSPVATKSTVAYEYNYNSDGSLNRAAIDGNAFMYQIMSYDELKRISGVVYSSGGYYNSVSYTYKSGTAGVIEKYVSSIGTGANAVESEYTVEYDSRGFVKKITDGAGKVIEYTYDRLGQLTREENELLGKDFFYYYDQAGNIEEKITYNSETGAVIKHEYFGYTDTEWGDLWTTYNGSEEYRSYDEIGNPEGYCAGLDRYLINWSGTLPTLINKEQAIMFFTYNGDGLRTSKTVDGVKHDYLWSGDVLISETWSNHRLVFLYDSTGSPIGMEYLNTATTSGAWETYWFEKNFFGDIVAVYNSSGTKLVSYLYDAWGNQTITTHVSGTAAQYNPFRYRGYYYDADLEFYYLMSRYYDSYVGRFISPEPNVFASGFDTGSGLVGYNVYAYCANNPVNYVDPTGEFALTSFLIGLGVAALIGAIVGAASYTVERVVEYSITGDFEWSLGGFVGSIVGGALAGMLTYALPTRGISNPFVLSFISGAINNASTMFGEKISGDANYSVENIIVSSFFAGFYSMFSSSLMSDIRIPGLNSGRGSFSAVTKQIYTKFRKGLIRNISAKTFGKMLSSSLYEGVGGTVIESEIQYTRSDNCPQEVFK